MDASRSLLWLPKVASRYPTSEEDPLGGEMHFEERFPVGFQSRQNRSYGKANPCHPTGSTRWVVAACETFLCETNRTGARIEALDIVLLDGTWGQARKMIKRVFRDK